MLLEQERNEVVRFGRKLITSQLTTGSGGNISIYNRQEGLVAVTPSGIEYFDMNAEDVVIVNLEGEVVDGVMKPTSEMGFHLALHRNRSDITAVVHTHSVYATTIACLNWELPAVHYLVGFSGNKVPIAPYATFGTPELAQNIVASIGNYNAVLLSNHGLVTVGPNLPTAFSAAEELELVARIYYQAKCIGDPVILPDDEMARVIEKFKTYGQKKA